MIHPPLTFILKLISKINKLKPHVHQNHSLCGLIKVSEGIIESVINYLIYTMVFPPDISQMFYFICQVFVLLNTLVGSNLQNIALIRESDALVIFYQKIVNLCFY